MNVFETNPRQLKSLLIQIQNGDLALPDFQRDFVWDPSAIEELIESIMRNYPAGSLLFLRHGGQGFKIREFEGAPLLRSPSTSFLALDGQQRLTSLFQAFYGKGDHRFFLSVKKMMESGSIEEAVYHESEKKSLKLGLSKIEVQSKELVCPLSVIMNEGFDSWAESVVESRNDSPEDAKALRKSIREINKTWIQPILDYQFPVITLGDQTSMDAVCKMFETLNRRGVKLTVFELLMARSFAGNVSLRQLWDQARSQYPILEEFEIDPYYILQVISLIAKGSIDRVDILNMDAKIFAEGWANATAALADSLEFLRKTCGVLSANLLPYQTMLVPLAAVWSRTSRTTGPKETSRRDKISKWFWASVYTQAYEKGPSSRAIIDNRELEAWISGSTTLPIAIRKLFFNSEMFEEITPKQRALYRGTLALICANESLDFHKSEKLTFDYLVKNKVDDHHIFPQNYICKNGGSNRGNCVLNKTLIDKKTNIRISGKAPSKYVDEIESEIGASKLRKILESHFINLSHLEADDFEAFLKERARSMLNKLSEVMEMPIPKSPPEIIADESDMDEDDEKPNPISRLPVDQVNQMPEEFLKDLSPVVRELFEAFTKELLGKFPDVWWRTNSRKVVFYSPEKSFLTCRLSTTGLHFVTFTDGQYLNLVEPILQKDSGGKLWGRTKIRTMSDIAEILRSVQESHTRMLIAISQDRPTAWWAVKRAKSA